MNKKKRVYDVLLDQLDDNELIDEQLKAIKNVTQHIANYYIVACTSCRIPFIPSELLDSRKKCNLCPNILYCGRIFCKEPYEAVVCKCGSWLCGPHAHLHVTGCGSKCAINGCKKVSCYVCEKKCESCDMPICEKHQVECSNCTATLCSMCVTYCDDCDVPRCKTCSCDC